MARLTGFPNASIRVTGPDGRMDPQFFRFLRQLYLFLQDGDDHVVGFSPSNYTPDGSIDEASDADAIAAHFKGVDTKLGTLIASTYSVLNSQTLTQGVENTIAHGLSSTPSAWIVAMKSVTGANITPGDTADDATNIYVYTDIGCTADIVLFP